MRRAVLYCSTPVQIYTRFGKEIRTKTSIDRRCPRFTSLYRTVVFRLYRSLCIPSVHTGIGGIPRSISIELFATRDNRTDGARVPWCLSRGSRTLVNIVIIWPLLRRHHDPSCCLLAQACSQDSRDTAWKTGQRSAKQRMRRTKPHGRLLGGVVLVMPPRVNWSGLTGAHGR